MLRNSSLRFLIGAVLLAGVVWLWPQWFASSFLGFLLWLGIFVYGSLLVAATLVTAADLLTEPANRVMPSPTWTDVALTGAGLGVLGWILLAAISRQMALTVLVSSVLVGLAMTAFVRWNAARTRRQTA